ncbi:MAG: hypothetical protein NW206_06620 [Hyphomonadaceae bacterium]|nr:hypothetical protein [Hyphomonadaceae bacterium]
MLESADTKARTKLPLAVDLDGTLIHSDVFTETILRFLFATPWKAPLLLLWLLKGRAHAKMRLAELHPPDVTLLPYDQRVVAWLEAEKKSGRMIVLATASDQRTAQAVADHLGLFERVFASDGVANLKSSRKAERLRDAFPGGFTYAGNETADLKVWRAAAYAVTVNAPARVTRRLKCRIETSFAAEHHPMRAFIETMRLATKIRRPELHQSRRGGAI